MSSGARVVVWRVTFDGISVAAEAAAEPIVHGGDVCSIDWDFTGTRLAAAALDGRVRYGGERTTGCLVAPCSRTLGVGFGAQISMANGASTALERG